MPRAGRQAWSPAPIRHPFRTAARRAVIKSSPHRWLFLPRRSPQAARPYVYASPALGVSARFCRDEVLQALSALGDPRRARTVALRSSTTSRATRSTPAYAYWSQSVVDAVAAARAHRRRSARDGDREYGRSRRARRVVLRRSIGLFADPGSAAEVPGFAIASESEAAAGQAGGGFAGVCQAGQAEQVFDGSGDRVQGEEGGVAARPGVLPDHEQRHVAAWLPAGQVGCLVRAVLAECVVPSSSFVVGDQDQDRTVLVRGGRSDQRQEAAKPPVRRGQGAGWRARVFPVVGPARGHPGKRREPAVAQIVVERPHGGGEVGHRDNPRPALRGTDPGIEDRRIVADLVGPRAGFAARRWHGFLVRLPGQPGIVELLVDVVLVTGARSIGAPVQ